MSELFIKLHEDKEGVSVFRKHDDGKEELLRSFTSDEINKNVMNDFLEEQPEYIAILEQHNWKNFGLSPEAEYLVNYAREQRGFL